jgi:hypothetical protein
MVKGKFMTNTFWMIGIVTASCFISNPCVAQTTPPTLSVQQVVEVTKVDFLTLPKLVSTSLSTFGVSLGMTRQEANEALKNSCPQCSVKAGDDSGSVDIDVPPIN